MHITGLIKVYFYSTVYQVVNSKTMMLTQDDEVASELFDICNIKVISWSNIWTD